MKKSTVTFFTLFLLSAFTSYLQLPPSAMAAHYVKDTAPVRDIDGIALRNGGLYEIIAVSDESDEGGIALAATEGETCPHTVVQANSLFPPSPPLPLTFPSPAPHAFLSEGDPVNVQFTALPSCAPSSLNNWNVVEDIPEGPAVKTGNEIVTGFKFQSAVRGYKIVYSSPKHSGHVGIYIDDDGFKRLVVTKNIPPLHVFFRNLLNSSSAA